jgi:hypothetical protein
MRTLLQNKILTCDHFPGQTCSSKTFSNALYPNDYPKPEEYYLSST